MSSKPAVSNRRAIDDASVHATWTDEDVNEFREASNIYVPGQLEQARRAWGYNPRRAI